MITKNTITLMILFLLAFGGTQAQISSYTFTQAAATYAAVTGGTVHSSGTADNDTYDNVSIGFTFKYDCVDYTTVSISTNGFIVLGGAASYYDYTPVSSSNRSIAALASDLKGAAGASEIRSVSSGSSPNRTFTIQWKRYKSYYDDGDYSFQIVLYETSNKIEIIYTTNTAPSNNTSFEVGLRGSSSADYNNRTKTNATNWIASAAGTANTSVMSVNTNTSRNPTGKYTWTPPAACSGTPSAGSATATPSTLTCTTTVAALNVTGSSSSCGLSYQWESSPDNAAWTTIGGATSATYSASPSANTWYRRITTCTGSATSSSVMVTTAAVPANDNCSGAITVPINAYGSCTSTISGDVSCATPSGILPAPCYGTPDRDLWYKFTAVSQTHFFDLTSSMDAYMQLFSGSCGSLSSIACSDPDEFTASGLTIGQTYYLRVYCYTSGTPGNGTFTLCVQSPPSCPGALGSGNVAIASLPYSGSALTTCGAGDDITPANAATCGDEYYFYDQDKVFTFTPATSGNITVTINSTQSYTAATLYDGCPFSSGCVGFVQDYDSGSKSFCTSVAAGTTYYLVIDSDYTSGGCITSFILNITAPVSGASNDLPCNATVLNPGSSENGNNNCTSAVAEPSVPSCWTSGVINGVWYSFVATSANMYVNTGLGTLTSTQVAVYSGTCSSLTEIACNEEAFTSGCSGSSNGNSGIDLSSLVVGATYFVRVDGQYDETGTFTIVVGNGVSPANLPVPGQDCSSPLLVCNSTMVIGNPGYAGTGHFCDFTGSGNCTTGEKNSVWYQVNIAATGNFNFTLMPNDGTNNSNGSETDYDFLLWKVSGSGTTTGCATISSASGTALLACNFSTDGVTGIAPSGNAPSPVNSYFNDAFEPTVAVTAGDVLYLVIQNFASSTQGFTLDLTPSGSGVVNYTAPSTVSWTGGAGTAWNNAVNWGSCSAYPVCGINAVVTVASANQPIISSGTQYVKNLVINPGATLTLGAGAILHVCGDFTNNGNMVFSPTSTVIFDGTNATQTISGNLTGTNAFGNVMITKTGGSVILSSTIEIGSDFTTSNSTSVVNTNGQRVYLSGHFSNADGNTTYSNTGTEGSLEFKGTGLQNYNQGASQLELNEVVLNNTAAAGSGVTLLSDMFIKTSSGTLTLTQGTVTTNAFKVHVLNTTPAAVNTGCSTSFINGNLRRYLASAGTYEWPLGNVAKGYQRARTVFSSSSIGYIDSRFDEWPATAGYPPIQGGTECAMTYGYAAENNGYWTLNANTGTAGYNMTLYPLNATNTSGMAGWTIMKKPNISTGSWIMNGSCSASTATVVNRNNMSGFSIFGVAQSITPLPIKLLSFTGRSEETSNYLQWVTGTEVNNDYFTLERSSNGYDFQEFAIVDGAGNSSAEITYDKYDFLPYFGVTYYRLKQTDFNGVFSYSDIIALTNGLDQISMGNVHPNPSSGEISFDFFSPVNGNVYIRMLDNTGRVVLAQTEHINQDQTKVNLLITHLAKGVYTLEVTFDKTQFSSLVKVVKN